MLNHTIHPSTLGGIKRYAKQLKSSLNIPHHEALDRAANAAGFANFAHANKQLRDTDSTAGEFTLYLTSFWNDRRTKKVGRELLEVNLSKAFANIINTQDLKRTSALSRFRLASPDHLVDDWINESQAASIDRICKALRLIKFVEHSGLKPLKFTPAVFPDRNEANRLPDSDHSSYWFEPSSGQIIYMDEPYSNAVDHPERVAWAKKHNWNLQLSKWGGIYAPGRTCMYLATDAGTGFDFSGLMSKIDNMPDAMTAELWSGKSEVGHEPFYSPLCTSSQDKKRAVPKGSIYRIDGGKTLPMYRWNSPQNERRPNGVMSVDNHLLAARLIKAIESSSKKPFSVNTRLSAIKSELESWFFCENDKTVTNQFDFFYYNGIGVDDPLVKQSDSQIGVIGLLNDLKALLSSEYVDCAPVRRLISKINASIKLTSRG